MDKLKMQTPNKADENFKKLAAMFPNAVTETIDENGEVVRAIDKDVLMQEINTRVVDGKEERYQFTWPDKKKSVLLANAPISKTLRPCREESVDFDNTENLYIEGDNLEVLKLLQETYLGKIKMIYIDPPYNTGNDFVYEDDFRTESLEFREKSGNYDEQGNLLTDRMTLNTESNGRFHTDWLNMIYPRLKLARDLLTDDGVIFISIDDNEIENLKKVCDEIFGQQNCACNLVWQKKTGASDAKGIATITENVLVYCKDVNQYATIFTKNTDSYDLNRYKFTDEFVDERGPYYIDNLDRGGLSYSDSLNYGIECPDGTMAFPNGRTEYINDGWIWKWSTQKIEWARKNKFIEFRKTDKKKSGWAVCYKNYLKVDNENKPIERAAPHKNLINDILNANAAATMKNLFGTNNYFNYSKPTELIKRILEYVQSDDSIILDFFSGSATTAHAVMQLNAEEIESVELSIENLDRNDPEYNSKLQVLNFKLQTAGHRKFIMVQLPEKTDENSEAYKAGYKNICEIGKERIRRAGDQILELSIKNLEKEGVIEKIDDAKFSALSSKDSKKKEGVTEKDARELSEIRSLEEVYGCGGTSVSACEETSTGGNLRTVRPNEKSGGVDSVEHCGGAVKGKEGIYPIFENSKGFTSRTGDTIVDLRTLEVLNRFGYRINFEYIRGNQQNDFFADSESKLQTLRAKLSFLRSDHGFRVLKIDTSNMKDVFYRPDEVEQDMFDNYANNIKPDRTAEDLLFQTMLDLGVLLSSKIEETTIAGCKVFNVDEGFLYACFDKDVTEDVITEIAKQKPYYFVMRDPSDSQYGDSLITNFEQIFATYSPNTQRKIL